MKRIVVIYAGLLVIMVAAMIGVTLRMRALERNEQRQALSAENERLALWRMESQLLPLILMESDRDYDHPRFLESDALAPPPEVSCYFRCDSAGSVELLGLAGDEFGGKSQSADSAEIQELLASDFRNPLFFDTLEVSSGSPEILVVDDEPNPAQKASISQIPNEELQLRQQASRSQNEFETRASNTMLMQQQFVNQGQRLTGFNFPVSTGPHPMTAFWIDRHLYLARNLEGGKIQQAEGCLLDWEHLKPELLAVIRDLLPKADLEPLPPDEPGDHHTLATLPVRLIPGPPNLSDLPVSSALKPTLTVAWSCFLLSAAALGMMLFGVVRLSERRAAFVSAVTHELRTPLTTFRLYSDLLADRESISEEKYDRYIGTLRNEAERLEYLIENVLSWSRLEQSAETQLIEDIDWNDLFQRIESSLRDRATQAGMSLEIPGESTDRPVRFRGNRTAVERILFNLIDNACKYAKQSDEKTIHIELKQDHNFVRIGVRDHGPGISPEVRSRIFQPFTKSAQEAARSAPGIGLGLSLSRRLARDMQGDLVLATSTSAGTTFELRLPRGH